jgi:hypothetical protein
LVLTAQGRPTHSCSRRRPHLLLGNLVELRVRSARLSCRPLGGRPIPEDRRALALNTKRRSPCLAIHPTVPNRRWISQA